MLLHCRKWLAWRKAWQLPGTAGGWGTLSAGLLIEHYSCHTALSDVWRFVGVDMVGMDLIHAWSGTA